MKVLQDPGAAETERLGSLPGLVQHEHEKQTCTEGKPDGVIAA